MKGKVIIAFLIICIAFILAWKVSRVAFQEMLHTVEEIKNEILFAYAVLLENDFFKTALWRPNR